MNPKGELRPGAVGVCESCGRSVLRQAVDPTTKTHATILSYGTVRVACGGTVRPLWDGALDPQEV